MFLLSSHQLVRYLVRTDKVPEPERLLRLRVENVSSNRSRNQCFLAFWGDEEAWFVKQSYFPSHYSAFDISNENRFYNLVADEELTVIQEVIPEQVRYDDEHRILLLKRLNGFSAVPERLYEGNGGTDLRLSDFPRRAAEVFRRVHQVQNIPNEAGRSRPFVASRPMLLQYQAAFIPQVLINNPRAHGSFLTMLTEALVAPGYAAGHLEQLEDGWESDFLLHGDADIRNFLYRETAHGSVELRLVDWELACWGDPCWDHALFFTGYIRAWTNGHVPTSHVFEHARQFHKAYYDSTDGPNLYEWREKVFRLAAVALLHQLIDEFLILLNKDKNRRNLKEQSDKARLGRRWFRLLCDGPYSFFRPKGPYPDASPRIFTAPLG